MQRKIADIADNQRGCLPLNFKQGLAQSPAKDNSTHLTHQAFFMKYASSIIQVINEQKLEKQNWKEGEGQQRNPIFEISEVHNYETEMLPKKSQNSLVLSNNYKNFGERFQKKNNNKHVLNYTFTNITLFFNHINYIQRNMLKRGFSLLKASVSRRKGKNAQPPKRKSIFHSDYTVSTSNSEQGLKKLNNLQQMLKKNQDIKESFNQIKGWIQFKILTKKSQAFKLISVLAKSKTIRKKQSNYLTHSALSSLQNDDSLYMVQKEEQISLVYTADQNFQFSQKEINVSSPEKASEEEQYNLFDKRKQPKIVFSSCRTVNSHEQIVETYQINHIKQSRVKLCKTEKVQQANPVILKLKKQRKHLILRTNTFELPFISDFYLKDEQIAFSPHLSLKKDILIQNQNEPHFSKDQFKKELSEIKQIFSGNQLFLKKCKQRPLINSFQNKFNTEVTLLKCKNPQSVSSTIKNDVHGANNNLKIQNTNKFQRKTQICQKQKCHKVQDDYFPNKQYKGNNLPTSMNETNNSRYKKCINQSQSKSLQTPKQKQNTTSPKIRIEERMLGSFPFQQQHKINEVKKGLFLAGKQKYVGSLIAQSKIKQKKGIGITSQHKISTSPHHISIHRAGKNEINMKPYYSPPSTLPNFTQLNQPKKALFVPKAVQIEYNQAKYSDKINRFSVNDRVISQQIQHNNIYKLNYPDQPKQCINNFVNFQKTDIRKVNSSLNHKVNNQIIPNKSPPHSPYFLHLNIPNKTQGFSNGIINQRSNSQKKVTLHYPQTQRNHFPLPDLFQHVKPQQKNYGRDDYNEQYFVRAGRVNKFQEKIFNFNKNHYASGGGIPSRPNEMISPIKLPQNVVPNTKIGKINLTQRPHSSFRETNECFNIFSNYLPMESKIQNIHRSNNYTSGNSSELIRPKSMNQKILIANRRKY